MKFIHMHERLRQEMQRRIQRGSLTVTLLSRQTGLAQAHISNFLLKKRRLSHAAMDLVLEAQNMSVEDLLVSLDRRPPDPLGSDASYVPVVSPASALFDRIIHAAATLAVMPLPAGTLSSVHSRGTGSRNTWQRFVALRVSADDALPIDPLILADALVVLDRHYNSLVPYTPARPSLYAIRKGARLVLRYADFIADRLILRPHNLAFPVELLEIEPGGRPQDLIAGRVVLVLNPT